jgi:hypothetical protein
MKYNFKIGDRVKIKNNLKGGKNYQELYFHPDMEVFRGMFFIIESMEEYGDTYRFKLKGNEWFYTPDMLERVDVTLRSLLE